MNPTQQMLLLGMLEVQPDVGYEAPFVVPTPRPYVVNLRHFGPTEKEQGQAKMALLDRVDALNKLLAMLGIDLCTAYRKEYTLNQTTVAALDREIDMRMAPENLGVARKLLAQLR